MSRLEGTMSELRGVMRLDGGILSWTDPAVLSDLERILGGEGPARCSIECSGVLELVAAARRLAEVEARRCGTCAHWYEARSSDGKVHWFNHDRCKLDQRPERDWRCADWRAR